MAGLLLLCLLGCAYFIPCIVAMNRKVNNCTGIVLINIFFGWTVLGWFAALIWACSAETFTNAQVKMLAYQRLVQGAYLPQVSQASNPQRYPTPPPPPPPSGF